MKWNVKPKKLKSGWIDQCYGVFTLDIGKLLHLKVIYKDGQYKSYINGIKLKNRFSYSKQAMDYCLESAQDYIKQLQFDFDQYKELHLMKGKKS